MARLHDPRSVALHSSLIAADEYRLEPFLAELFKPHRSTRTPLGLLLTQPGVHRLSADSPDRSSPCEILPSCPICGIDQLQKAAERADIIICVCVACGTSMTVPREALRRLQARLG